MIVVDATVLADFLIGDEGLKASAEALAEEDPEWISTSLWRYELGNVLWKVARFQGKDANDLRGLLEASGELLLATEDDVDLPEIWQIAVASGLTFYDASYVWLAQAKGLRLRTRDAQVLKLFPGLAFPMPPS